MLPQDCPKMPETATFAFYHLHPTAPKGRPLSGEVILRLPAIGTGIEGKFNIKSDMITVSCGGKKKTTQLGGVDPLNLAEMLMRELVGEVAREAA